MQDANGRHLGTEHLNADVRGHSIRGAAATISAQIAKVGLKVLETAILARILTPADFGLIAMVAAFSGLLILFSDAGLSMATVQRKEVSQGQVSNLFWINTGIGFLLTLAFVTIAPLIAIFYNEPRLVPIAISIAGTFLLGGLAVQHTALLKRQMRFTSLATADVIATSLAVITAVLLAKQGAGYWALVGLIVAKPFAYLILVWLMSGWRPSLPKRHTGMRPMLVFGGKLVAFDLVNYISRNADNVLIGYAWGPSILGLYSRAYELMMLPVIAIRGPLVSVGLAAMSRLQDDRKRFRQYYIRIVEAVAFLSMPLAALLFVLSEDVVSLVLGAAWADASPIFSALALTAFIQPSAGMRGLVLLSSGQAGRYLRLGIGVSLVTVASFLFGLQWGGVGVAIAYGFANYFLLYPTLKYSFRSTDIEVRDYFRAVAEPVLASILAVFIALVCLSVMQDSKIFIRVITCSTVFACTYLAVCYLVSLRTGFLGRMANYATELISRGK